MPITKYQLTSLVALTAAGVFILGCGTSTAGKPLAGIGVSGKGQRPFCYVFDGQVASRIMKILPYKGMTCRMATSTFTEIEIEVGNPSLAAFLIEVDSKMEGYRVEWVKRSTGPHESPNPRRN